jgi:hypothetical protein
LTLILSVAILCSFVGCGSVADYEAPDKNGGVLVEDDYGMEEGGSTGSSVVSDRKIITTVNERVETEAYDALIEGLKTAVSEAGGYFVSSSYSGSGVETEKTRKATFEIRIPAEGLSAFTGRLGTLGTVLSYKETANDVTLAYVDLESRIAVLEAEEAALLAILAGATNTTEIVEIRKSLTNTQSDLASLRAQKKTYDTLVAYSTVRLSVSEVAHARSADGTFFSEVGDDFMESLSAIGGFFRGLFVFLLGSSPILILLGAVGVGAFFIARAVLRARSEKRKTQTKPSPQKIDEDEIE